MKATSPTEQTRLEAFQTIAQLYTYVFDLPAVLRRQKPLSALVGLAELAGLLASVGMSIVALDQYNLVLGRLASTIYLRNLAQFKRQTAQGAVWGFLYSIGIMLSKALYQRISALWRNTLTRLVQRRYVRSTAYYLQRPGAAGHSISDPDQRILEDVQRTSTMMAVAFYKSVSTTSNAIQAIVRLSLSVNPRYVLFSIGYLWVTQKLRETMVPAMQLSRLNAATSKATGEYASAFRRLLSSCEPIVALGGTACEKRRMLNTYSQVKERQRDTLTSTTKDTYIWYSAPTTTLQPLFMQLLVEVPFLLASRRGVASAFNQNDARHDMAANAQVLGQMTLVTTLVIRMMKQVRVLMILPRQLLGVAGTGGRVVDLLNACHSLGSKPTDSHERVNLTTEDMRPLIALEGLTVRSPAGDVLVRDLTLEIKPGGNLLIVGANGVGKTSIFRAMRGLWPKEGSVTLPPRQVCHGDRPGMMFLPQVPYCPRGSLTDVLTYPHPVGKSGASVTKESMRSLLVAVDLEYLLEGFPAVVGSEANSNEVLSLGERQRLAVARLLYHRPVFAVLDECTSTFSEELAERVYWAMDAHDITIVTISHRPKHKRFHQQQLSLTGEGAWALTATDPGVQTPPATPPATPRAAFDPSTTTPQARRTEKSACEKAGPEISSGPNRNMARQATVIRRLVMILHILTSRGRSTTFLLLHVACIFLSVGLQSRILAALPGQLQALAMQSNRAAYINLSMSAFGFRLLSAGSRFLSAWAGNMLNIEWQGELTQHIINRMMGADSLFYKLELDKRIDDVETRVVADVNLLAAAMQSIITSMLTPISSAVLATRLLVSANLPLAAINIIWAYGISGVLIQKFWAPDYAVFAALTSAKQGVFRRGHQRLIANAESVAMMSGEERELETLEEMLDDVTRESHRQLYYLTRFNCLNYWFTQYLPILVTNGMRMFWAMGYGSDQAILSEANGTGISSKGLYLENLITQSFEATVGLLSLNNYFQTLFGHIVRVTDLLLVIGEIQTGTGTTQPQSTDSVPDGHGQEDISLTNVNIVVPDGTQLITGLELRLRPGERLMVTGNGKSSVFRVLTGVWHARGVVNAPRDSLSVPQQPLVTCTPTDLLTYLSYPLELNRREQTNARAELQKLLEGFGADYVIKREGWIVCRHWVDVLSLGELQCLALARAFFLLSYNGSRLTGTTTEPSAPSQYSWLFLDDCTSALTAEVEVKVYRQVEEVTATDNVRGHKVGVVSFGSGERESLSGFHNRVLRLGIDSMAIKRHCNWQLEAVPEHVPGHASLNEQHPSEFRLEELQLGQGALDRS